MAGKITGITIKIDGDITEFQKSIRTLKEESNDLYKEMQSVNKALKFNPGDVTLTANKVSILKDQIGATEKNLTELKKAAKEMKKQGLDKSEPEKWRRLQTEIVTTKSKLSNYKKELIKTKDEANKFNKAVWETGEALQKAGDKMQGAGKKLTAGVTTPIIAAGTASFLSAAEVEDAVGAVEQIYGDSAGTIKDWAGELPAYYGIAKDEALGYASTMGAMLKNIGGLTNKEASEQAQTLIELSGDLSAMFGGSTEQAMYALQGALKGQTNMLDNYGMGVNDATIKAKAFEMGLYSGKGAMDLQTKQAATLALIMEQTGDAQGQASREADGASGSIKSLKTSIKNLSIELGEVLLPIITPWINKLSELASKFKELTPEQKEMIVKVAGIAAAIGPVLLVVGKLSSGLGGLMKAFPGVNAVMKALLSPAGLIVAAIAVVAGVFIYAYKNSEEFRNKVQALWEKIQEFGKGIGDWIQSDLIPKLKELGEFLKKIWDQYIGPFLIQAAEFIVDTLIPLLADFIGKVIAWVTDDLIPIIKKIWEFLSDVWSNQIEPLIKNVIAPFIEWFINYIVDFVVNDLIPIIQQIWDFIKNVWNNLLKPLLDKILPMIKTFIDAIAGFIENILIPIIKDIFNTAKNIWDNLLRPLIEGIIGFVERNLENIKDFFSGILDAVHGVFKFFKSLFTGDWRGMWEGIKDIFSGVWEAIKSAFEVILDAIVSIGGKILEPFAEFFVNLWEGVKTTVSNIWNGIRDAIWKPIEWARDKVKGIIDAIKGFFSFKISWPKIPMPHFGIKPAGWKIGDLLKGSIPRLGIDWYDKGGIFRAPTVIGVGEKRPEFVGALEDLRFLIGDELDKRAAGGDITNNFNIASVVVREEADINRIADALYKKQLRENRGRGLA